MKYAKAKGLLRVNIEKLSLEQLQAHRVKLLDAWRESKAFYGMAQAVADGFYKVLVSESASGYSPTDIWLTHSLNQRINEVEALERRMLSRTADGCRV